VASMRAVDSSAVVIMELVEAVEVFSAPPRIELVIGKSSLHVAVDQAQVVANENLKISGL
jgi:hypothetical protein